MKYLFINHKMNMTSVDIVEYLENLKEIKNKGIELSIFPSYVFIPYFFGKDISFGGQNVSIYTEGAFTGEVSAKQLKSLNAKYCLVGHSERRIIFDEWDEDVNEKIHRLQENDITPVLCIGEKKIDDREEVLIRQLSVDLKDINLDNIIIAYEPVYSIGTGIILENTEIENAIRLIKNYIKLTYNVDIPVLYGGSVDEKNISKLVKITSIDGFLIGKAGLDIEKVKKIIEEVKK